MSLVNDMLRDLDQRRQQAPDSTGIAMSPAPGQSISSNSTRWLPLTVLALVVGVALAGLWLYDNPQLWQSKIAPIVGAKTTAAKVEKKDIAAKPAAAVVAEEIELQQLDWSQQNRQLQLLLTLNRAPMQRVEVSTDRSLVLELGAVQVGDGALPEAPVELIQSAQLLRSGGKLSLQLATSQPVQFDVAASNSGGRYQLKIAIEPQLAAEVEAQVMPVAVLATSTDTVEVAVNTAEQSPANNALADKAQPKVTRQPQATVKAASKPSAKAVAPSPRMPLRKLVQKTPQQLDQAMVVKASGLVGQRQLSLAQQQLSDFINDHPAALDSRTLLATLKIGTQQQEQAERLIDSGLELDAMHLGLRKLKARLLLQAGQLTAAIELLSQSMPAVANDTEFHQIRAASLQTAGQHQQAAQAYHGLLNVRSSEPSWWVGLALSLEALQQPRQARQAYQNVLKVPQLSPTLADFVEQRLARLGG